mmetsp:Transcript_3819/g.8630  ORF Transcript_3819/g.8630 Transcript_3819/m.8630 type:complete len:95 (+) Transcript_3819:1221-1505(+)
MPRCNKPIGSPPKYVDKEHGQLVPQGEGIDLCILMLLPLHKSCTVPPCETGSHTHTPTHNFALFSLPWKMWFQNPSHTHTHTHIQLLDFFIILA